MKLNSPAKINLTLDIKGKDASYHFVDTILHQIDLQDELDFQIIDSDEIIIESNDSDLPLNEQNTVYQAAVLLHEIWKNGSSRTNSLNSNPGIKINIHKNIPLSSGLGGGSSNAAATLKALNQLWGLKLSKQQLAELAMKIGMDTPFFLEGGTAFGTHYGEEVTPLPSVKLPPHLIAINDQKQSTAELYKKIDSTKTGQNIESTQELSNYLSLSSSNTLPTSQWQHFHNDFNALQSQKTGTLQKKLLHLGAEVVHICGSGPALYALFKSETNKRNAFKELKGQVGFIWESH